MIPRTSRLLIQDEAGHYLQYLLAVVNNEHYIPVFIDLKTGRYGRT